jgi:ribonuclease Z
MSFELTVLGSSSALPTSRRFPAAHVLNVHEHFFLIDCGEGTQMQLRKFKIRMGKINHIFISHLHGDHVFGLFGLFSTFNLMGRQHPLHLYAHTDMKNLLEFYHKHFTNKQDYEIVLHPLHAKETSLIYEDKFLTVESIPLKHRIPTSGFLFKEKTRLRNIRKEIIKRYDISVRDIIKIKEGDDYYTSDGQQIKNSQLTLPSYHPRSYAYFTDTLFVKKNSEKIKDVDLLYHEATFMHDQKKLARQTYHSTAKQAGEMAKAAEAKKLIIGHFSSRYKDVSPLVAEAAQEFRPVFAAEDGDKYIIEMKREE